MTPYFRRSMSPMERHGCRGRGEILSPKTHGHVLLRESRFQERVLGDQWDTYPRLEALCQSISEKRAFVRGFMRCLWCHITPKIPGSWPLFVNEATCPTQIQRPEDFIQSVSVSSDGFLLQHILL